MTIKQAIETIKTLLGQSNIFINRNQIDLAIRFVNTASNLFEEYDNQNIEFNALLDEMCSIRDIIIKIQLSQYQGSLITQYEQSLYNQFDM